MVKASRDYNDLRNAIEPGPHGNVHYGIGGDFSTMASVTDPIFW